MTDEIQRDEEMSSAEREALVAWTVPPMPADFGERVLLRRRRRRQRRLMTLAAAASVVTAAGLLVHWTRSGPTQGERQLARRTTVHLGQRAVAVAEGGSALRWQVGRGGRTSVRQSRGGVFYRVDPGAPFTVTTPGGTVRVLGTCFRVEVVMKASKAGLLGGAAGAAAATLVLVSVYEGRVLTAAPSGKTLEVNPGEAARIDPDQPRRLDPDSARAVARRPTGRQRRAASVPRGDDPEKQELVVRAKTLEQQVEILKQQLAEQNDPAKSRTKMLDLTQEELTAMAKGCELRWDLPGTGSEPHEISPKDAKKLGLDDNEVAQVNEAFAAEHRRLRAALIELYIEVTGNADGAEALSPWALMSEIDDKSRKEDLAAVYQRLARERAGLHKPLPPGTPQSAEERLMRLLTTAGDRAERAIGARVGPDLARRLRELHGGWGSKSRSRRDCPR